MAKRNIINEYHRHESLKNYICFYCDSYGESKDHVPPISVCNGDLCEEIEKIIVRSCILCNSLLGYRPFFTLYSRCEYLITAYRRKFFKHLSLPNWNEEELSNLTGRLKSTVVLGIKRKKDIEKRIIHLEKVKDGLENSSNLTVVGSTEKILP